MVTTSASSRRAKSVVTIWITCSKLDAASSVSTAVWTRVWLARLARVVPMSVRCWPFSLAMSSRCRLRMNCCMSTTPAPPCAEGGVSRSRISGRSTKKSGCRLRKAMTSLALATRSVAIGGGVSVAALSLVRSNADSLFGRGAEFLLVVEDRLAGLLPIGKEGGEALVGQRMGKDLAHGLDKVAPGLGDERWVGGDAVHESRRGEIANVGYVSSVEEKFHACLFLLIPLSARV